MPPVKERGRIPPGSHFYHADCSSSGHTSADSPHMDGHNFDMEANREIKAGRICNLYMVTE